MKRVGLSGLEATSLAIGANLNGIFMAKEDFFGVIVGPTETSKVFGNEIGVIKTTLAYVSSDGGERDDNDLAGHFRNDLIKNFGERAC